MLCLLSCICLAKVASGICLVFRVAGCAMVIHRSFLVGLLTRLGDYDWLFVLGHAMVIRPMCCVHWDRDSLVGWLEMFTCFSCCNSNLPVLSGRTVVRLFLLCDADLLGWFDYLLVDNYWLLQFWCVHDSWFTGYFWKTFLLLSSSCWLWLLRDISCFLVAPRRLLFCWWF